MSKETLEEGMDEHKEQDLDERYVLYGKILWMVTGVLFGFVLGDVWTQHIRDWSASLFQPTISAGPRAALWIGSPGTYVSSGGVSTIGTAVSSVYYVYDNVASRTFTVGAPGASITQGDTTWKYGAGVWHINSDGTAVSSSGVAPYVSVKKKLRISSTGAYVWWPGVLDGEIYNW